MAMFAVVGSSLTVILQSDRTTLRYTYGAIYTSYAIYLRCDMFRFAKRDYNRHQVPPKLLIPNSSFLNEKN